MDWTIFMFMTFPALLIGTAFGVLVASAMSGTNVFQTNHALAAFSFAGALLGVVLFWFSAAWWPPVIGPFILCPIGAVAGSAAAILCSKGK